MLGIATYREEAAVDLGMEGLHPSVHHLREASNFTNFTDIETRIAKFGRSAARRDDFDIVPGEASREILEARLVG